MDNTASTPSRDDRDSAKWEALSFRLWPHGMFLLAMTALAGTMLDFITTYDLLENSTKPVVEGNPFARALLERGGWPFLFAKDLIVVGLYATTAYLIYRVGVWRGIMGRARLLSSVILLVYLWARLIPAINNVLLSRI